MARFGGVAVVAAAAKHLIYVLLVEHLGEEGLEVDGAERDERARGINAVGLRRDVIPIFLVGQSTGHVGVVDVAEEQADGHAGDAPLVVQRRVPVRDRLGVILADASRRVVDENVKEEAQHQIRDAQQGGEAVEEELAERLGLADAGPQTGDAACGRDGVRGRARCVLSRKCAASSERPGPRPRDA